MTKTNSNDIDKITNILKEVYDPEFPLVDIYTLWLIYDVTIKENKIFVLMTFTSPVCPMWDYLIEMVKTWINKEFPEMEVDVEITFEPMRSPENIKDEDLKLMFQE